MQPRRPTTSLRLVLRRLVVRCAGLGLLAIGLLAAGSGADVEPGEVVAVAGRAEGLFFDIDITAPSEDDAPPPATEGSAHAQSGIPVSYGPAPVVEVGPQSGARSDSLAEISIPTGPFPPFTTAFTEVSTEGTTGRHGSTRSSARLSNFDFGGISGEQAISDCEANPASVTGSARFVNATVPSDPAPNTVVTKAEVPVLADNITIILNEQEVVSDASGNRIEVTALHVFADPSPDAVFVGEFYIGRAVCGVTFAAPTPTVVTPPVVEPTFTG